MSDSEPTANKDHVVLGMATALGAFLMFTVMNALAKLLSVNHSVIEISFYRNVVALVPFLIAIFVFGHRDIAVTHGKGGWIAFRAVFGTVSLTATFWAFSLMPMADTTALLFTSSLFIPILGIIFLGERVGMWRWTAVLVGFAGVLIMVRPTGHLYALGISIALGAAFLQAILQIVLRYIGRYERPETVTFYFFLIGTLITALPLPFIFVKPTLAEIPLLLGIGLSGAAAQWLFSTAFSHAPAVIVTVFNYSGIVWATFFGWLIWDDWPLPMVLAGATIVIASNVLIIWRESRIRRITGDRVRAKL
ncbi:MAG TPA: DMT family transporter [Woeseiaceae bacterium]|nr:DMT family transporter [Woeseiaceae bacterium]